MSWWLLDLGGCTETHCTISPLCDVYKWQERDAQTSVSPVPSLCSKERTSASSNAKQPVSRDGPKLSAHEERTLHRRIITAALLGNRRETRHTSSVFVTVMRYLRLANLERKEVYSVSQFWSHLVRRSCWQGPQRCGAPHGEKQTSVSVCLLWSPFLQSHQDSIMGLAWMTWSNPNQLPKIPPLNHGSHSVSTLLIFPNADQISAHEALGTHSNDTQTKAPSYAVDPRYKELAMGMGAAVKELLETPASHIKGSGFESQLHARLQLPEKACSGRQMVMTTRVGNLV